MLSKQSQIHIKINNLRLILNIIFKKDQTSRADIVRITKISTPTVSSLIDELIKRNIILEIGTGVSKLGRKPILLEFNKTLKYFLAVDIGRVYSTIAVTDLKGKIIKESTQDYLTNKDLKIRFEMIKSGMMALLKDLNLDMDNILKILFITPTVFVEKNKALKLIPLNEKTEIDIREFFQNELKKEVLVKHSTKIALYGEKKCGIAKPYKNAVYIDFAYGLGCALMINEKVYFDVNDSAGEFGYFYSSIDEFNNFTITPFNFGALEKRISGKAIQDKAINTIKTNKQSKILELVNGDIKKINTKIVFDAAKVNDPIAYSILKESFNYFNMALCNIINLVAPEIVIFAGGFSKSGVFLLNLVKDEIKNKILLMPKIEVSKLKKNAEIIGAVQYLIDHTDFLSEL